MFVANHIEEGHENMKSGAERATEFAETFDHEGDEGQAEQRNGEAGVTPAAATRRGAPAARIPAARG